MLRLLCALIVMAAVPATGQTIYKCPDTNGRIALQDIPCVGGEQRHVRPASGSDQKPTASTGKAGDAPKPDAVNDLDRLRNSVGKDAAARKFKDADYEVGVYNQRINNFPIYRATTLKQRAKYYNCGTTKYPVSCEDMDNYRAVDAELSAELNQMRDMRTNTEAVKRAANKEYFAITKKWLED